MVQARFWRLLFGVACLWTLAAQTSWGQPKAGAVENKPAEKPAAEKEPDPTAVAKEAIARLIQDRQYEEAIAQIDALLAKEPKKSEQLLYLKGRALHHQQKFDEAVLAFDSLAQKFPKSVWARRANLAKGVSLARKGDFRAAEAIYRAEAEYLLSQDRKQQIAEIYLEFAQGYFRPADETQQPNYQKALDFFLKVLEVGPKPDQRDEIELLVGRCFENLGNFDEAIKRFKQFSVDHSNSPLDLEARFRLGESHLKKGENTEARRTWQDMLEKYTESKSERIPEAAYRIALTHQVPTPPSAEDLTLGVAALEAFVERFPQHKLASVALLNIGQTFAHAGRYEDAVQSFQRLIDDERYQDREELPEARFLLGQGFQLQKKFAEALAHWRDYLAKHPAHKNWSAAQRAIVDTEYLMAAEARHQKKYDDALRLWNEFLAKYPLDERAAAILFEQGAMQFDQENWEAALADWRRLVSKYPGTDVASAAQFRIALTIEQKFGKLEEALEEFRKVTWGGSAGLAQQRIALLTAKQMTVETERVFRTNEPARIKLTARNIEAVTVRAYVIDLETYFRKMHLAGGVEGLDIALIDPDKTFEYKLTDYVKHQELIREIELPLLDKAGQAGVMAVTVSSPTLEATTLVVRSDLDMIVKSSRDEVFVFAQNMRTGKPAPGARLLVSNGKNVFAEAITGKDGVFRQSYEELKSAADVRVFAVQAGNVASNIVGLSGVGVAQGLSEKGYLYTDRPAYRPGQWVNLRGVVRRVADDAYVVDSGKEFQLEVFDTRSRAVWQEKVKLNEFGSFRSNFVLPVTSPLGSYRMQLSEQGKPKYAGSFAVHEYSLDTVQLSVDTGRMVYYRGEEIEGKFTAKFYYGAPLVGREIRYQLAGEKVHTAVTDKQGEVKFKLPTREFRQTQMLPLVVMLPERNLQITANFVLATQGFSLSLSTVRPVFLAGETFETTLRATDAEGKPTAQKLTLSVLEQTTVDGRRGERLVEKHDLETGKDTGTARVTLKLAAGGKYTLRAEGTDRFHNPITGQYAVQISGEEDMTRLRILADKHSYKAGDTAEVAVHWRETPALALVTFQGAKVLDYKLVPLKTGANTISIPMDAKLAPNFDLAVAVMTDTRPKLAAAAALPAGKPKDKNAAAKIPVVVAGQEQPLVRFHEASSPFEVERELVVKIETKPAGDAKTPLPGAPLEVKITTTDPQGNPVAAEVSLAMIEKSLLERYGDPLGKIQEFFAGARRQAEVRTSSSIAFAYRPATQSINPRLLAERDRLELAEEEARRLTATGTELSFSLGLNVGGVEGQPGPGDAEAPAEEARASEEPASDLAANTAADGSTNGVEMEQTTDDAYDAPANRSDVGGVGGTHGRISKQLAKPKTLRRLELGGGQRQSGAKSGKEFTLESSSGTETDGDQTEGQNLYLGVERFAQTQFWAAEYGSGAAPASGRELKRFSTRLQTRDVAGLQRNGVLSYYNLAAADGKKAEALAKQMNAAGTVLLPQLGYQETGYWNPAIVTDEKGTATLTFDLPDRSTAWKLLAKGITKATLAGESDVELVAKKELFGELKLPMAFTDGDNAQIVATIHNSTLAKGELLVKLTSTIGGKSTSESKAVAVTETGMHELAFDVKIARPEGRAAPKDAAAGPDIWATFQLSVRVEDAAAKVEPAAADVVVRTVPVRPFGMPVFRTASGTAQADTTAWVELPAEMPVASPSLEIVVGPTVQQSLLDILLGSAPWCQIEVANYAASLDTTTSDLMAGIALQKLIGGTREAAGPQAEALDTRIRAAIGSLISAQQDEGGWSWTGRGGATNRYGSARAVWALAVAKSAGYRIADEVWSKSLTYLESEVAKTADTDYESKAVLLHALAVAGRGDFPLANRLHRNRPSLSTAALLHLALAFAEMDRQPMAAELIQLLAKRDLDEAAPRRRAAEASLPSNAAAAELRALYALMLEKVEPNHPQLKPTIDWLMSHRTGHRWSPDKATGPAALAVCHWHASARFDNEHYKLTVFVNDHQVKVLEVEADARTESIVVPAEFFVKGKQRINFQLTGRGRFTYQCILGGFVAADKLASTTKDWRIERYYEPAPREIDGRELPRGFGNVTGSYSYFRNSLTQLPVGKRGQVHLHVSRDQVPSGTPDEHLEYLVVTEPLPSGATVVETSITGDFERYELAPGAITFYLGNRRYFSPINYDLHGYLPGQYVAAPSVLRNAYRPEQLAVAAAKPLAVLPLGTASKDEYRLTPQELFELGKLHFAKGEMAVVVQHLTALTTGWTLNADAYRESTRMLLEAHLQVGPPAKVVHYFEIIKEKWPEEEIAFDKILKIGAAYDEMGEYERSFLIFRATIESSFLQESRVAGFLNDQGEPLRSIEVMQRILGEYPPEPFVAAATYYLAQHVYALAPQAATHPKLREKKLTRVDLIRQALGMLEGFMTGYPDDPAADQAAFSAAGALLELKQYEAAIAACLRYAARYPNSQYLDSYWYTIGYCHFARGEHKQALEMCAKVAEAKRKDPATGQMVESENRWRAIYILGQIYHSLGQAAEAIREYARVKDRFADAARAIDYFSDRAINLPEVTTIEPGKPATLDLKFRNVAKCDVRVYRIDLMKFSLLKRDLSGITSINLSGIRPLHEELIKLGDGKDYAWRTQKLELPLEKEGAYLVVCRGDDLHASGLVLVTPLAVEVQEEASAGSVRTTIKDAAGKRFVSNVHVKVIGSRNDDFVSGDTDLRGVFVAEQIRGTSTVIAQADDGRYAFYRGQTSLGPAEQPQAGQAQPAAETKPGSQSKKDQVEGELLDGLQRGNRMIQEQQIDNLQRLYRNNEKGVRVKSAR